VDEVSRPHPPDEDRRAACAALPMRTREDSCARTLRDLLHTETPGRRLFWRFARAVSRLRWLLPPSLRSFGATQTFDCRSSPRTRTISAPSYNFALPRMSCQGRPALSQMPPLVLELWREQHPLGHEQTTLDFKAKFPEAKTGTLFLDRLTVSCDRTFLDKASARTCSVRSSPRGSHL
jgi:hypothetical protein